MYCIKELLISLVKEVVITGTVFGME